MTVTKRYCIRTAAIVGMLTSAVVLPAVVFAHNVSKRDGAFVQANPGTAIAPLLYLQNRDDKETALKTMDPDVISSRPKVPNQVIH